MPLFNISSSAGGPKAIRSTSGYLSCPVNWFLFYFWLSSTLFVLPSFFLLDLFPLHLNNLVSITYRVLFLLTLVLLHHLVLPSSSSTVVLSLPHPSVSIPLFLLPSSFIWVSASSILFPSVSFLLHLRLSPFFCSQSIACSPILQTRIPYFFFSSWSSLLFTFYGHALRTSTCVFCRT